MKVNFYRPHRWLDYVMEKSIVNLFIASRGISVWWNIDSSFLVSQGEKKIKFTGVDDES